MFTKKQLDDIRSVGKEGLSLKAAASRLGMTYSDFLEEYEENKEAQLKFEQGESDLELEIVTVARSGMMEGAKHSFEFFANKVNGKNPNKDLATKKTKQDKVPDILLNPDLLSELDDDELQREIMAQQDQDAAKQPIKKVEVEDYKEDSEEALKTTTKTKGK